MRADSIFLEARASARPSIIAKADGIVTVIALELDRQAVESGALWLAGVFTGFLDLVNHACVHRNPFCYLAHSGKDKARQISLAGAAQFAYLDRMIC